MKIVFANQLRGVAAMMVVISHLLGSYFFQKPYISAVIGSDIEPRIHSDFLIVSMISSHFGNVNFGPLGVSIFFLISGFVIMFSIGKMDSGKFMIQRWFRIFPVYWFSLLVCLAFTLISSSYFGNESGYFGYDLGGILANLFLYNDIAGYSSMDFVNWSLTLELTFYVLFSMCAAFSRNGKRISMMLMTVMALIMVFFFIANKHSINLPQWMLTAIYRSKFIDYMCIGHVFYLHFKKEISIAKLFIMSSAFFGLFWVEMYIEGDVNQMIIIGTNYLYGISIFSLCYIFRSKFREFKPLDFMADLSYPLYLLHATCGYALISILLDKGIGINLSFLIALSIIILAAWVMHKVIEVPSNKLGKKITSKAC